MSFSLSDRVCGFQCGPLHSPELISVYRVFLLQLTLSQRLILLLKLLQLLCWHLDITGLLHQAPCVLCCPVAFWELDPEKFQRTLKVSLKQVFLGGLQKSQRHIKDDVQTLTQEQVGDMEDHAERELGGKQC